MPKIGLISDTHGHLDTKVFDLFDGVDHILHGGDIGWASIILELEGIAPVTAVLGNNDDNPNFRETEVVEVANRKFLVHHIVDPKAPSEPLRRKMYHAQPQVVVFGHSHKPFSEMIDGTLFVNPGYAGKPRFNLKR
ncbi:MAG TPA: metallophosphoesterase family protein, partial [Roseimicrobium sp.]|nr:metallophosphoesterase family protein [Roseimicrobium sp.]